MVKKLHIKENTASIWDMNVAAKQCADEALNNFKQGIEDFEIEINTKLDRPSFWQTFRKEMTNNGLDFEITEKDTTWNDHYYYMYLYNLNNDLEESYNNNTEEQELAEFLDFLKEDGITVSNVNRKFKQIYVTNEKDLDTASFYLHDRDYFKKLSDFGWVVALPNKSLGKQLARTLKMESIEFDGFTYSNEDIVEALAYMYGISYEEVHKALKNNEFTDKEIKRAITYWNLDGYNPKEKQAEYNRRCKELGIWEDTEHTYRVWYRPYLLDGDEEDYTDVTASNEDEARRKARILGWVVDVELLESKQLNEDETVDIENALQNFIAYNSNKNLDRIQKRIACTTEFDNGHVMHGDWQKIPVIDAELMAKEKSLKNPDKTYYVQYDDLMIGSSDLQWKNGRFKAW